MTAAIVRTTIRAAGSKFMEPEALYSRKDRNAKAILRRIGGYAVRVAKNSLKPKRDLPFAQFPDQLKLLIGASRMAIRRNAKGQFLAGSGKKLLADLRKDLSHWPQSTGEPGGPPRVTVRITKAGKRFTQFKNLIRADVEGFESVVFGPESRTSADVPGDVEFGGSQPRKKMVWKKVYRKGKPFFVFTREGTESKNHKPRPYIGPAFDRTMDALIPSIFREYI